MNRIDKLILKARAAASPGLEVSVALIERDGNSWAAEIHLRGGGTGQPHTIKRATWATLDRAVEHIRTMAAKYPNSRDVPIIVDDLE